MITINLDEILNNSTNGEVNDTQKIKERIINKKIANYLYNFEIDDLCPGDTLSDDDYQVFLKDVVGKTIWEYCIWRYPDNPEEQLNIIIIN